MKLHSVSIPRHDTESIWPNETILRLVGAKGQLHGTSTFIVLTPRIIIADAKKTPPPAAISMNVRWNFWFLFRLLALLLYVYFICWEHAISNNNKRPESRGNRVHLSGWNLQSPGRIESQWLDPGFDTRKKQRSVVMKLQNLHSKATIGLTFRRLDGHAVKFSPSVCVGKDKITEDKVLFFRAAEKKQLEDIQRCLEREPTSYLGIWICVSCS